MGKLSLNDMWYQWLRGQLPDQVINGEQIDNGSLSALAPAEQTVSSLVGTVTGTDTGTAGLEIARINTTDLPKGMYKVEVFSQMVAGTTVTTPNNLRLENGFTSVATLQHAAVVQDVASFPVRIPFTMFQRMDGATSLSVNFINDMVAGETQEWHVTINATKVGL